MKKASEAEQIFLNQNLTTTFIDGGLQPCLTASGNSVQGTYQRTLYIKAAPQDEQQFLEIAKEFIEITPAALTITSSSDPDSIVSVVGEDSYGKYSFGSHPTYDDLAVFAVTTICGDSFIYMGDLEFEN